MENRRMPFLLMGIYLRYNDIDYLMLTWLISYYLFPIIHSLYMPACRYLPFSMATSYRIPSLAPAWIWVMSWRDVTGLGSMR